MGTLYGSVVGATLFLVAQSYLQDVLRVASDGTSSEVSVSDNGSGIDAQLLPHVFDLFTQADRAPDRSQGGLGLGLALVKANGTYDVLYEKWFGILEPRRLSLAQFTKYLTPVLILAILASVAYLVERRIRPRAREELLQLQARLQEFLLPVLSYLEFPP